MENLKEKLTEWLKDFGSVEVKIASPDKGFEYLPRELAPKSIWSECQSIIVIAIENKGKSNALKLNSILHKGRIFLKHYNFKSSLTQPAVKIAAESAGVGVIGKMGKIINPVHGSNLAIAALMTNAKMEFDSELENFKPCSNCLDCSNFCSYKYVNNCISRPA